MNPVSAFINPRTRLLRGGWRAIIFYSLSPQLLLLLLLRADKPANGKVLDVSFALVLTYAIYIGWTVLVSWLCLRFLDGLRLSSLGFTFHNNWGREILSGATMGILMVMSVVLLQMAGGGTRIQPSPIWWRTGEADYTGLMIVAGETIFALVVLILAAASEELGYRGYPFQTLLRSTPPAAAICLSAFLFGVAHWGNPNRTFFSTINTVLAGIWLSVAYLKTRSLWFPTSLHFTWNWMMGPFFGLPVSGLHIPQHPIFVSTSDNPFWLTGGSYGCEGGAAATFVLMIAILVIVKAKWFTVSVES